MMVGHGTSGQGRDWSPWGACVGESRGGTLRALFVQPLGVLYRVSDDDRLVTVIAAWEW